MVPSSSDIVWEVSELGGTPRGLAMTEPLFQPHSEGTLHQPSGQKVEEEKEEEGPPEKLLLVSSLHILLPNMDR